MEESKLEALRLKLRNDFRIKDGTDYTILHKYGKTVLTCLAVYADLISDVAWLFEIKFDLVYGLPTDF